MLDIVLRIALDPKIATYAGAAIAGHSDFAPRLERICERESLCELISQHEGDLWMERKLGRGLSTRGVHGMVAAFALPYLPDVLRWAPLLDIPLVSAYAATKRAFSRRCEAVLACRSWRGANTAFRS